MGVRATKPLLGVQTGIDLLEALWAVPLHQLHGEVGAAQLGDEICRYRDPLAGPGAVDHVVQLTVSQGILALMCHECASAGRRPGARGFPSGVAGPRRTPRARTAPMRLVFPRLRGAQRPHVRRLRRGSPSDAPVILAACARRTISRSVYFALSKGRVWRVCEGCGEGGGCGCFPRHRKGGKMGIRRLSM